MDQDFVPPAIPEKMQKIRDIAAKFLQAVHDEGFVVTGLLFSSKDDTSIISLQNTNDDAVKLMRASADMLERKIRSGAPVTHDHVRRTH